MADKIKALPAWLQWSAIILAFMICWSTFVVPILIVKSEYDDIHSLSTLPLGYWLLLLMQVISLFVLNFVMSKIYGKPVAIVLQKWKISREVFWFLGALVFGYLLVKNGLDGDFIALSPSIPIVLLASLIMGVRRVGTITGKKES